MNIEHKIINLDNRDYHMHSMNFSDGFNTVEEIVRYAGELGMIEIAITDHSDAGMDNLTNEFGVSKNSFRYIVKGWENIHNDINVIFGVEADILNENGDISDLIQGKKSDFVNLSAHIDVYEGDRNTINKAYENAIKRHYKDIKCICHPCSIPNFGNEVDIEFLVKLANEYGIALELNGKYLRKGDTHIEKLHFLLQNTSKIYINSDAHTLYDLRENRKFAINFLMENGYIN